jgi:hypothetical protein
MLYIEATFRGSSQKSDSEFCNNIFVALILLIFQIRRRKQKSQKKLLVRNRRLKVPIKSHKITKTLKRKKETL